MFVTLKEDAPESIPAKIDYGPGSAGERPRDFIVKDSGQRESFPSGMVRDVREDKGRYDLITPFGLKRLALVYERGARKYSPRNWEKGAPFSRFIDSAQRHIEQFKAGLIDEDHLAHACWNLMAIMHLQETHPELDDMPHYLKDEEKNG